MPSHPQVTRWLAENGPKELDLLFRAIVYHPSAPILLADNDRRYLEASVGASKLLGLPREKIIGRSLDDFAEPSFKPVISERWRSFLEEGEQQGTLRLVGRDGTPRGVEDSARGRVPAEAQCRWTRTPPRALFRLGCRTMRCSCWMYTERLSSGMRERSAFTAT